MSGDYADTYRHPDRRPLAPRKYKDSAWQGYSTQARNSRPPEDDPEQWEHFRYRGYEFVVDPRPNPTLHSRAGVRAALDKLYPDGWDELATERREHYKRTSGGGDELRAKAERIRAAVFGRRSAGNPMAVPGPDAGTEQQQEAATHRSDDWF